jgi:hypothetical protein
MNSKPMDIEQRVSTHLSVSRYLRSSERFNEASKEFTAACKDLRGRVGTNNRFVVQVDFKHYLVTSDNAGNFDVEQIESL